MKKSAKTMLEWEQSQSGNENNLHARHGKYELCIWQGNIDGIKTFQGCICSHTGNGRQPLSDLRSSDPQTQLSEIKKTLLNKLKKIIAL